MSKIDDLIERLCPNGVKFYNYNELFEIKTGKGITTRDSSDNGKYPIISGGIEPMGYYNEYNRNANCVTISRVGANAGYVNFIENDFYLNDKCFSIIPKKECIDKINSKFLYYYSKSIEKNIVDLQSEGGVPTINTQKVGNLLFPVPPLEVQNEIVHILDDFTLLSAKLSAELSAELKARQQQYDYYRNTLLKSSNNIKNVKFGDVAKIQRGASPRPISRFITDDENGVNWIKIGDVEEGKKYITHCKEKITIEGSKKSRFVEKGDFILSNSMSFGRPYILAIDGCIHDGWLSISDFQNYYLADYLYHLLNSNDIQNMFRQKASFGGAIHNLNADIVRNIELPLIPIGEQQKVADVLDKFEKYCNDISEGLPAEIEARQKQYEYYRDKLLTFKELVNEG